MNIGDIVQLASGSPRMTIVGIAPSGMITTAWVAYNTGVPHSICAHYSAFKSATLTPTTWKKVRRYNDEVDEDSY